MSRRSVCGVESNFPGKSLPHWKQGLLNVVTAINQSLSEVLKLSHHLHA